MSEPSSPSISTSFDKLVARIRGLRAKTIGNGCTEGEALAAAAKVAELLDRHDLSVSDLEVREATCHRREYAPPRKKRIPLDDCLGEIAAFCDCRVWREKNEAGEAIYVFFGLRADTEAAHCLTEMIEGAVRHELGRYKASRDYLQFRHQERHLANASFSLGMIAAIADRLIEMKKARDKANKSSKRSLVLVKCAVVDREMEKLGLELHTQERPRRWVAPLAYDAGGVAGDGMDISRGLPARHCGR